MTPLRRADGSPARCAQVGAGAIGGSFAAHLIAGGWDDLLVVDAHREHVDAIAADGLRVEGAGVSLHVTPRAVHVEELAEPLDVVFLAVKSQHTAAALTAIRPWLQDDGYVVTLQNGLNVDTATGIVGAGRVIAGFVNWAADYHAPGLIRFGGLSHFVLGEPGGGLSPRLRALGDSLEPAFPAVLTTDILGYLWSKQVSIGLMFSAGISHRSIPESFDDPELAPLFARLAAEGAAVARSAGATLQLLDDFDPAAYAGGDPVRAMKRTADHYRAFEKQHTGLYRDLAIRGRPSEVDGTIGVTIAHADSSGLDRGGHALALRFVHEIEAGEREIGDASLFELRDRVVKLGPYAGA